MKKNKILLVLGCLSMGVGAIGVARAVVSPAKEAVAAATTVTSTIATIAKASSWVNGTAYTSWALDSVVTISTTGTGNNAKYYSSDSSWRLYQSGDGNLIVTVAAGYTLTSVSATYTVSKTGTLTGLKSATTTAASGTSVTYVVGNTGSGTTGNVQITSLTVVYDVSSAPSVSIDNAPAAELSAGETGTLTATVVNATGATVTWSSDNACLTINSSTGAYTANSYGTANVTASIAVSGTAYTNTAKININESVTLAQALAIGGALASGATTSYTVNVSGTISAVATKSLTISNGTDSLLIYGTYSPDNAASKGWGIGGTISYKGALMNYSGTTVEMTSPTCLSYTGNALALANFVMMAETADQCKTQFAIAKNQYLAMTVAEQTLFNTAQTGEATVITNGRLRYEAWAVNQNAAPYTDGSSPLNIVLRNTNSPDFAIAGGVLGLGAVLAFVFFFRKKKRA